ncbi:MAG: hypothetical protein F8N37_03335 [Telmatospirillum sp.]|nr:hypothetical protein [Telmatospirillum sp.]
MTDAIQPVGPAEPEPFIPYKDEKDFAPYLRPVVEPYKRRMGFLPNALKLYAWRPEIAETLWQLNSKIMRDPSQTLDQFLKRRLAAVACATNGCGYCTAHSCSMLKRDPESGAEGWGLSDQEVAGIVSGDLAPKDEFERGCFDFVRAASRDPGAVPDDIYDRLKAHLTPEQIVELACVVGFWKFYNAVHDALRIPIEASLAPDARYVALAGQ